MSERDRPRPRESDRRLRHNFRLARLLRFLELVSGHGCWNPQRLMQELEVSERTLHRLRETLELAGVPLFFSREENAYRVRPGYRFPTLNLSDEEALTQGVATALTESAAFKLPRGAHRVTRKIADGGNERVRKILDDVARLTEVLDLQIADHPLQRETLQTVQWALIERKMLGGRYRSPFESAATTLKLHPYRLTLVKQAWYLIARCDGESQPRTFRVVRFQSLKLIDRATEVPEDFDLRSYFGNAWSVFRGEPTFEVELRFTAEAADVVLEHIWHRTQKSRRHANGEVTLTFVVDGLNEIVRWIVGWAGRVRVVRPTELRELVVEQHRRAVAANLEES